MREKLQHEMEDADCGLWDTRGEKVAENVGPWYWISSGKSGTGNGAGDLVFLEGLA
jgi:hypothetical protein